MKLADDALLLRRMPYGESSLVVHALTREGGRRHLIAKGVFRPRSRFFAALDLFDTLDLGWSESSRRDLGTLQRAEIRRRRHAIARSLERYRTGLTTGGRVHRWPALVVLNTDPSCWSRGVEHDLFFLLKH